MSLFGRPLPGSGTMLLRTLRAAEWSQLRSYASASFFDVLPARALLTQLRELGGNAADPQRFRIAQRAAEACFAGEPRPIVVGREARESPPPLASLDEAGRRDRGQRVLEVYFRQLRAGPVAILDLRANRFVDGPGALHWSPRPLWVRWDEAFLAGVRDLYGGFYDGDDARFGRALSGLGIDAAEDVFRAHLGAGDQRAVRFEAATLQATLHEAFVRCRDAGARLAPNFLALGIYLGCLHDHLEALGLAFDVREAYERSAPGGAAR